MKKNTLFGEEFQSKLTSMVEKETALAKAVSITKRHKRKRALLPTRRQGPARPSGFFKRAPLASMGTGGARIFNRTHSMQVKTGTPSEVPTCPTDQAKNHSFMSHDFPYLHQSKNPNRESISGAFPKLFSQVWGYL